MSAAFLFNAEEVFAVLDLLEPLLEERELGRAFSTGTGYENFVQTVEDQAWMHEGRWPTDEDAALDFEPDMRDKLIEGFSDVIEGGASSIDKYVEFVLETISEFMTGYPPEPSGSLYRRTFDLADSWTSELFI